MAMTFAITLLASVTFSLLMPFPLLMPKPQSMLSELTKPRQGDDMIKSLVDRERSLLHTCRE